MLRWPEISTATSDQLIVPSKPSQPQSFKEFHNVWCSAFPTLKIALRGSDFCDFRVSYSNEIKKSEVEERMLLGEELADHGDNAILGYRSYCNLRRSRQVNSNSSVVHLTFDSAEKVTLPSIKRQPGQLHFVTGLKYDKFGITYTNIGLPKVFGLPEGYWSESKDATSVFSMLYFFITELKNIG